MLSKLKQEKSQNGNSEQNLFSSLSFIINSSEKIHVEDLDDPEEQKLNNLDVEQIEKDIDAINTLINHNCDADLPESSITGHGYYEEMNNIKKLKQAILIEYAYHLRHDLCGDMTENPTRLVSCVKSILVSMDEDNDDPKLGRMLNSVSDGDEDISMERFLDVVTMCMIRNGSES